MIRLKIPVSKLAIFITFLVIGLWMARTIHDPFHHSTSAKPEFSIITPPAEQYRLLLIIVENISKPALQSIWWIGSREDMPTAMVSIYPSITQQAFRNADLTEAFQLSGMWSQRKPNQEFFELLDEWEIRWNDYLVIDLAMQAAIIDQVGGIFYNGQVLSGKEANQLAMKMTPQEQLPFQSNVWSTLCSHASKNPKGINLNDLPLSLKNHTLSSLGSGKKVSFELFPYQPTFPVCMVNAGLMEAAMPPFIPTK